jgi:hypothetical protein
MNDGVTIEELKKIAPTLTVNQTDETLNALIENAHLIALGDHFPKIVNIDGDSLPVRSMATRYMALHLISVQGKAAQGIVSEKVAVLERHYSDMSNSNWLDSSKWGQAYLRLYKEYGGSSRPRYVVIQH